MNKKYWKKFLREEPKDEFSKNLKFVVQNCSQKEVVRQMQEAVFLLYGSICNLCFNLNKEEYVNDFKARLFDVYLWLKVVDYYYNQSNCEVNNESYNRQLTTLKSFVEQLKNR